MVELLNSEFACNLTHRLKVEDFCITNREIIYKALDKALFFEDF